MIKKQKHTVHPGDSLFIVINSFNKDGEPIKGVTRLIISKIDHSYDEEFVYDDEKSWTRSKSTKTRIHCYACNNFQVKAINIIKRRELIRNYFNILGDMKVFNRNSTFKNGKSYYVEYPGRLYVDDDRFVSHIDRCIPIFTSYENAMDYLHKEKSENSKE